MSTIAIGGGGTSPPPKEWKFLQCFGERTPGEEVQEADIISAVEFDSTGEHLATGDRGGRVVLFEGVESDAGREDPDKRAPVRSDNIEYRYSTEFQSHEPEFDYLKSLEIEEKINKIRWCRTQGGARFLLSTNDKTIKLWKVYEKRVKNVSTFKNVDPVRGGITMPGAYNNQKIDWDKVARDVEAKSKKAGGSLAGRLRLPQISSGEVVLTASCRRVFSNAHVYHINSIAMNSDNETYISADDLRVNLWNLEISNQSFNIVDIKPTNMEDLTEVITSADFHPSNCSLFAYSSSKGSIRLADMRDSALCDRHAKLYEEPEPPGVRSFFSEIIASISDIKFGSGGRYILSRDYMTMKLWDVNMERAPVATFSVHEHLRSRLCDLYENDSIFDKFECTLNGAGTHVATGSYSNLFRVFGANDGSDLPLEASKTPHRRRLEMEAKGRKGRGKAGAGAGGSDVDGLMESEYGAKLLHLTWHPHANVIACAASNSMYMFSG
mmetsp:Transcript_50687/g.162252  ORF Transcript_50687/g.162252 Transcript_50687/m.162252 type:complete len:495 (-) Transcript_50687:67-1551(-)|eukprot:CAMPEP_0182902978 /NCGR_PEP_ID=MMETSP0034_2-20130328/30900_1 /TAXON_ID=156128 /ORGANISM="Nephroselmis pyriformis, Strain CCMP717" /LENGTH=494 /DNA_ID=CAMNT_0025037763 /DNA_START=254 /DNA_END=1741 /DNA_ORIENTATION=+